MFLLRGIKTFTDRKEAGEHLGKWISEKFKGENCIVLGVPRGGIEVGAAIAGILKCPLDVIVTKKLPLPVNKEVGFGAVAEDGSVFLTNLSKYLSEDQIEEIRKKQLKEIDRRVQLYRGGKGLPSLEGKTVILTDDGIATGSTIVPALQLLKKRNPGKILLAVPVSGDNILPEIEALTDEIMILDKPEDFYAVGQVYEDFHQLVDEEVIDLLKKANKR